MSRRRFLECAAGAVGSALVTALPAELAALGRGSQRDESAVECALLDLGEECCIPESIAGYESALAQLGVPAMRIGARSALRCATLIVPSAGRVSPVTSAIIRSSLDDGARVILESGAVFMDPEGADFRAHRDSLREELQLHIASAISLWPRRTSAGGIPYVDYSWPTAARVRDFSRVVPLSSHAPRDLIIARVGDTPVALMRRSGSGTLVFLGSPLGPGLRCGDGEAREWLGETLTVAWDSSVTSTRSC